MQFVLFVTFVFVAGVFTRIYLFFSGIRGGRPTVGESIVSVTRNETLLWGLWKKMSSLGTDGGPRAELDSYGFFADIPDEQWQEMKKETKTMIDLQDGIGSRTSYLLSESGANINSNVWWSDNWKVSAVGCYVAFTFRAAFFSDGTSICRPTSIAKIKLKLVGIGYVIQHVLLPWRMKHLLPNAEGKKRRIRNVSCIYPGEWPWAFHSSS